jgi:hypothetical protein
MSTVLVRVHEVSSPCLPVEQAKQKLFMGVSTDPIKVMVEVCMVGVAGLTDFIPEVGDSRRTACHSMVGLMVLDAHMLVALHRSRPLAQDQVRMIAITPCLRIKTWRRSVLELVP